MEFGLTRQLGRSLNHTGCHRGCAGLGRPVRPGRLQKLASAFDDFRRHRAHNNGKASAPFGGSPNNTNISKVSAGGGKSAKADKGVPKEFKNTNRYWVPLDAVEAFEKEWRHRELFMQEMEGFHELTVSREDEDYVVSSAWQSIPEWEKWSLSEVARRSHLPNGIFQYVPDKGAGFPDDFVPFRDMQQAVNARY